MKKLRVGLCGLGGRGMGLLTSVILRNQDASVVAVCDSYAPRIKDAQKAVFESSGVTPFGTENYQEIIDNSDVDIVVVATAWESHIEIACKAMRAGKITTMEVGGAYSIDDCWQLVRTYEQTKTPFFFMENCCYGKDELLATNLVRAGLFGDIVYCHGCYAHDLREEIAYGIKNHHYRLRNYLNRNCENYPTHELGPIAKIFNINRGNKLESLVSVASRAASMQAYVATRSDLPDLQQKKFMQGDIVNTIITCADGSTISLRLDTTMPRVYDREFTVRGTKGMYSQTTNTVLIDGKFKEWDLLKCYYDNAKEFEKEYLPDVWKSITQEDIDSGHGGMDSIMFAEFVSAVNKGEPMPLDVYDAATWMSVSCLSEQSIATKNAVAIPDFTGGKWLLRAPKDVIKF